MRKSLFILLVSLLGYVQTMAQSNNALSIYEGERIQSVEFIYDNLPSDSIEATPLRQQVEQTFLVYPYTHFNEFRVTPGYLFRQALFTDL